MESGNFEVTLAAPGEQAVKGFDNQGHIINDNGGTSMATPQVTAAAAMIRALNPALDAEGIKKILTETARSAVDIDGKKVTAPAGLGGKILAIDQAVLKVINDLRSKKVPPLKPLKMEDSLALARIELTAGNDPAAPQDWKVSAHLAGVVASGADVTLDLQGEGAVGGKKKQHLSQSGSLNWDVTIKDTASVVVSRQDSGGCSRLALASESTGAKAKKGPRWVLANVSEEVHEDLESACIPENKVQISGNSLAMSSSFDLAAEDCAKALVSGTVYSKISWTNPTAEIAYDQSTNMTVTVLQDAKDIKYAKSTGSGGWEMVPATDPEVLAMYLGEAPYYETEATLDYHRSCPPEEVQKRGHCPEEIYLKESWNDSIRIWTGQNSSQTFSFTMPLGSEIEEGDDVVFKLRFEGPGGNATLTYTYLFQGNFTDVFGEGWTDPMRHFS